MAWRWTPSTERSAEAMLWGVTVAMGCRKETPQEQL
eukprot:CAMPEP_0114662564 /NCGR_PEP_ID=MMETSP0191-20121206/25056_1 /TAXON_ID=126664 /ORGANISM="Sorites sp." /LENGTH=35 /DNA_ID= /DNA_START= /DNA_END= /DNA_ORIENTATION=